MHKALKILIYCYEYAMGEICLYIIHYHNQFKLGRKQKQKEKGPIESEKELKFL